MQTASEVLSGAYMYRPNPLHRQLLSERETQSHTQPVINCSNVYNISGCRPSSVPRRPLMHCGARDELSAPFRQGVEQVILILHRASRNLDPPSASLSRWTRRGGPLLFSSVMPQPIEESGLPLSLSLSASLFLASCPRVCREGKVCLSRAPSRRSCRFLFIW